MRLFAFIISLAFLLMASCEKEAHLDIPPNDPKIVVNALLFPEKEIEILVQKSKYVLDNSIQELTNAIVILSSDNGNIDTLIHKGNGIYYKENLIAHSGICYNLEIKCKNLPTVFASDCIPYPPIIDSFKLFKDNEINKYNVTYSECKIYLTDNAQYDIIYMPYLHAIKYSEFPELSKNKRDVNSYSKIVYSESIPETGNLFYFNEKFKGKQIEFSIFYQTNIDIQDSILLDMDTKIFSVSQEYYNYRDSYTTYYTQGNLYTNIKNGYGIFAGVAPSNSFQWSETIINKWDDYYLY